ncbi:MAG: hypothetical protein FJY29_12885 [Betaproteobacteria bacterium]|nr:hypothetical protein [Betaproteobacteria bacterium]
MKSLIFNAVLASFALMKVGCRAGEKELAGTHSNLPAWTLSLQLDSFRLNDSVGLKSSELSLQVADRLRVSSFFDPVGNSPYNTALQAPISGTFSIESRNNSVMEYRWTRQMSVRAANSFATCSAPVFGSRQFVACENQRVLECLGRRAQQFGSDALSEASSSAESSLLMQWLKSCGVDLQFANLIDANVSFKIEAGQLFFSPSPLSSLLIYKGSWPSYEEAQVQAIAAATLPQVSECNRADGSCLVSPVALSQCIGCAGLEKGKIHTVFFFEGLRQDYSDIKSLVFIPE